MKCVKCGKCCQHGVEVDIEEAKKLIIKYGKMFHEMHFDKDFPSGFAVSTSIKDGKCMFLKKRKCSIYKDRPEYCKQFPFENGKLSPIANNCIAVKVSGKVP
ncbi:MAG: YkgJ family cysteine cluster protein, partial [Candidatus Omnitrophota bacterium]